MVGAMQKSWQFGAGQTRLARLASEAQQQRTLQVPRRLSQQARQA